MKEIHKRYFLDTICHIEGNKELREPQIEAFLKIQSHFKENPNEEALVVLPTGTGKSGLIAIAPFRTSQGRVLIITPGKVTKASISKTMDMLEDNFWINRKVIFNIENTPTLISYESDARESDLTNSNIIYTNVQKLNKQNKNSLVNRVSSDFFDMIIVDEAHHAPANTWKQTLEYFSNAKILHITGTPYRGDGVKVPGKLIHETKLSEVMEARYIKWLRNKTLTSHEIYFIDENNNKLSIEQAKLLHNDEWVQRSVALSDECSLEVIKSSIEELNKLKEISPKVPHKIMASACSIRHAERLYKLYTEENMKAILIHSKLPLNEQQKRFKNIELNECDVVINVGMMGEGYDHRYLTIAALFRPYKSLNMFAQIIGRVLRAIPEDEITKYEIDNNALVIYHKELGMDNLWNYFRKELKDKDKYTKVKEMNFDEYDGERKETIYGKTILEGSSIESVDSYSSNINFCDEFEKARKNIDKEMKSKRETLREQGFSEDDIDAMLEGLEKRKIKQEDDRINELYNEKRPYERRVMIKKMLDTKTKISVVDLLKEFKIDEKGLQLYPKFKKYLPTYIKANTKNDGVLVIFINCKIKKRFGQRAELDIPDFLKVEKYLENTLFDEIRRMLNGLIL